MDFLLEAASLEASVATRSKMSESRTLEFGTKPQYGHSMGLTIDEGVQDGHGAVGDTSIWVDLLEN